MSFTRTTCAHCRKKLIKDRPSQKVHLECVEEYIAAQAEKAERAAQKQAKSLERLEQKDRRDQAARLEDLHKQAQQAFNAWIRWRDREEDCISCGAYPPDTDGLHAGRDAGHFRSVGAAKHLRYHEDNVNAQCVSCNRDKAGNVAQYRVRLAAKIGEERLQALENDNRVHHWKREELLQIRNEYRERLKRDKKNG